MTFLFVKTPASPGEGPLFLPNELQYIPHQWDCLEFSLLTREEEEEEEEVFILACNK